MTDYIREAVELAGWLTTEGEYRIPDLGYGHIKTMPQSVKDALAAQLTRQVDALDGGYVGTHNRFTEVGTKNSIRKEAWDNDRTINTIKAIIDSGVLSEQ